jgi:hypothetical protein
LAEGKVHETTRLHRRAPRRRRCHLVRADYLAGLTDEVSREECNVAGATANIEYAHAGADPAS